MSEIGARQPVRGRDAIRHAYEDKGLADDYIRSRYEHDRFGRSVHEAQVSVLKTLLRRRAGARTLEVGCGPARLTADLTEVTRGFAIDASRPMLANAAMRLGERGVGGWRLLCGDAFELPFAAGHFDVVLSFKLVRHFDAQARRTLLREFARVLKPGGLLLFDVAHNRASEWLYKRWAISGSWVDDYHFSASSLIDEVEREPFSVRRMHAIHRPILWQYVLDARVATKWPRLADACGRAANRLPFGQPLEWIAECCRA